MTKSVAVILAGGVGHRIGLATPKQLIKIAGKPILEHTLAAFDSHPDVDEIIVMMAPGHLDRVYDILRPGHYPKVSRVLEGGSTRNETTLRALRQIQDPSTKVLFHDAVRPFVNHRVISDCLLALDTYDAVDVAISSADTIIEVADGLITDIPDRSSLRRGQTPQGFRAGLLARAYELAGACPGGLRATDDCGVVRAALPEVPIRVVQGDERNMKVTEPLDLFIADKLFQLSSSASAPVSDEQFFEALGGKTVVVFGASYGIGETIADLAEKFGAHVHRFSRSGSGTHVERREDLKAVASDVFAREGRIDHVINAAAVLTRGALADMTEEAVYQAIEVNYIAPIFIAQEFYRYLRDSRGSLLLFTSSSYTRGRKDYSLYSSAKAAVVNLTQALADEWSPDGIAVNCINPERTATPMRTRAFGAEDPGTLLDATEVARTALSAVVTGETGHVIDVRLDDPSTAMAAMGEVLTPE